MPNWQLFKRILKKPADSPTLTDDALSKKDKFKLNETKTDPTIISKSSTRRTNAIRKFINIGVFVILVFHVVGYCMLISSYNDQNNIEPNEIEVLSKLEKNNNIIRQIESMEKELAVLNKALLVNEEIHTQAQQPKAIMIIAVYPSSADSILAIWSQLECFSNAYEKIIIVYSVEHDDQISKGFEEIISNLLSEVSRKMPEIFLKIETRVYYENIMRDTGLWCNYLTASNVLQKGSNGTYVGGAAYYDSFLLINDSVMALEHSNELLDTLHTKKQSLVSLNFWGEKNNSNSNNTSPFWVESVARVFDLEGIQIFSDKICSRKDKISWRKHCPEVDELHPQWPNLTKIKKCIVLLMEVQIASMYSPNRVWGLYPGGVPKLMINVYGVTELIPPWTLSSSWTSHYIYWKSILRDKMKFPGLKVTNEPFFRYVIDHHPKVMNTCLKRENNALGFSRLIQKDCEYNLLCHLKVLFSM